MSDFLREKIEDLFFGLLASLFEVASLAAVSVAVFVARGIVVADIVVSKVMSSPFVGALVASFIGAGKAISSF